MPFNENIYDISENNNDSDNEFFTAQQSQTNDKYNLYLKEPLVIQKGSVITYYKQFY